MTATNETFHLSFVINRVVLELGIGLMLAFMRIFLGSRSCLEGQGYDNVLKVPVLQSCLNTFWFLIAPPSMRTSMVRCT